MLMASVALLATLAGCQDANCACFDQEYAADGACCQTPCAGCPQCGRECASDCPCACQEEEEENTCCAGGELDDWLARQALGESEPHQLRPSQLGELAESGIATFGGLTHQLR